MAPGDTSGGQCSHELRGEPLERCRGQTSLLREESWKNGAREAPEVTVASSYAASAKTTDNVHEANSTVYGLNDDLTLEQVSFNQG